ncbi:S1 RNA-binding domain-containing protein [Patescibacteria group bacterium]|nr:S1 RNA-binding domain-containing protein [Patescibacteria group bacterium]MBU4057538.1 S1 RNA-binding domain-containing protein [Patescibacteria group bacterium]MBU4116082.1 S1 RNA-binding domain-containing protein [Patescibacteria group bacterium]
MSIKKSEEDLSAPPTMPMHENHTEQIEEVENGSIDTETKKKSYFANIPKIDNAGIKKPQSKMGTLFGETKNFPATGELVDGLAIAIEKSCIYVDLPPYGTGIIYGKEFINARDIIKGINIGDIISAKIIGAENEEGYIELSLKEARQAIIWNEANEAIENKKIFEVVVKEANKGGLMLEWRGLQGFLPASQLSAEHYPRVEDGEKDKILSELKNLVGQKLSVSIISVSPKEGKLIFSERTPEQSEKIDIVEKYNVDNEIEGQITGIVDFGVFVKIEEGLEGLVHISELDWGLVENPKNLFKVGEVVKAKIIEIKSDKISLSIKALKKNPWDNAEKKYEKGKEVEGVVIKFNKHGALASIEEGIAGLVHISEFASEEELKQKLELGKKYKFSITVFEPKERKMALALVNQESK